MESTTTAGLRAGRTQAELLVLQVQAVDAWVRARGDAQECDTADRAGAQPAADLGREAATRLQERDALRARVADHLSLSGGPLAARVPVRAIVAHRSPCTRTAFACALKARGISVVGSCTDAAQAVGTAVAEQPDLVLVEDQLPTAPTPELVRRLREFAPSAVVAALTVHGSHRGDLVEAGAHCVCACVPPDDVVALLVRGLAGGAGPALRPTPSSAADRPARLTAAGSPPAPAHWTGGVDGDGASTQ